jgi:hypothetical protein
MTGDMYYNCMYMGSLLKRRGKEQFLSNVQVHRSGTVRYDHAVILTNATSPPSLSLKLLIKRGHYAPRKSEVNTKIWIHVGSMYVEFRKATTVNQAYSADNGKPAFKITL